MRIPDPLLDSFYSAHHTTPAAVLAEVLAGVDAERYLDPGDLAALRARATCT